MSKVYIDVHQQGKARERNLHKSQNLIKNDSIYVYLKLCCFFLSPVYKEERLVGISIMYSFHRLECNYKVKHTVSRCQVVRPFLL